MTMEGTAALLLVGHGTVENLDDLPAFVSNIRRGHPAPPELLIELRRRYEAIGGKSPLTSISSSLVRKVEQTLRVPTRLAMRLWHPYPKEVLAPLVQEGVKRVVVVALAQHSSAVYAEAVRKAAAELDPSLEIVAAANWGRTPSLLDAYAAEISRAMKSLPRGERRETWAIVMTAHSLPTSIIEAGDVYEIEVRASAAEIAARLGPSSVEHVVAFQSQGFGGGGSWLGPELPSVLEDLARQGKKRVIFAPIGFLADHVEILYDIDIEARAWANERGLASVRTRSLNDSDALVRVIAGVASPLLRAA